MGELIFVGLGLYDELDISLRGLEMIKRADYVYAEFYTSLMAGFHLKKLKELTGKKIIAVSRKVLEEENGEVILQKATNAKVVFLVPGDPLIATTHIDLRIQAEKHSIKTHVVHGASIISAAIGLSGLQNYKFGRSVTVPFPEGGFLSEIPYDVISENKTRDLHTLCFLDIQAEKQRCMTIKEALTLLLTLEQKKKQHVVTQDSLAVTVSRAGAEDATVRAEKVGNLMKLDFGAPPHALIFPAEKLHFMEAEALVRLANAPEWLRVMIR